MVKIVRGTFIFKICDFIDKFPKYKDQISKDDICSFETYVLFVEKSPKNSDFINLEKVLGEFQKNLHIKKLIVIVEKCSPVKIYDKLDKLLVNIEFFVGNGAQLTFFYDPKIDSQEKIVLYRFFNLQESSCLNCFLWLTDARNIHTDLKVSLKGRYAKANINGVYFADKEQNVSLTTCQEHLEKNTQSSVIINGVVANNASVKYDGKVFVSQHACKSKVVQKNKNIVLGDGAKIDAMPSMEVLNNDVECKHGCAIGFLDEMQLFYLQSRGLDEQQAKRLLVESFFDFLVNLLDNQRLKDSLAKRIRVKMRQIL